MTEEKYLTLKEASRFLKISTSTLNRLIRQNGIPSYKIGHRRLFDKDELIEWVRNPVTRAKCRGCNHWKEDVYYTLQDGPFCTDCLKKKYPDLYKNELDSSKHK